MRLINADKLIELFSPFVSEDKKVVYQPRQLKIDDIKNAPTVKAITAEWITNWLTKQTIPATSYGLDCSAIEKMLDDWEKENEAD